MQVTFLAAGTRGDTQPYIALGLALKKVGHTARIAAFENNADFVKSCGLDFYPIKGDITQIVQSDTGLEAMKADNPLKILRKKLTAERLSAAINEVLTDQIRAAAKDLGSKIQSENGAATAVQIIIQCVELNSNVPKRSTH